MARTAPPPLLMPDGRVAPSVLTWREMAELLRIEGSDQQRRATLAHLRNTGRLRGIRAGRAMTYSSDEAREFIHTRGNG